MAENAQRTEPVFGIPDEAANDQAPGRQFERFTFTGSGAEYFRIWIVNLCLTVATLGIYSAWAKVRRLQYFDRNTVLAGAVFDFDGDPKVILRGRVLAVLLAGAYQYAFGFSVAAGVSVVALLLASLPYMMRGALRFRLRNTRYRGLRFHFTGSARGAYEAYLLPIMLFLLPAALLAIDPASKTAIALPLAYLLWPLFHGVMKRYQHGHAAFGSLAASFTVKPRQFYKPYLAALGLALLGGTVLIVGTLAMSWALNLIFKLDQFALWRGGLGSALGGFLLAYLFYLLAGPYLQVRIGNLAWNATSCPGVEVLSEMQAREYMRLQTVNTVLTLLTLGLYRPFAVVRSYRYRIEKVILIVEGDIAHLVAGDGAAGSANADGVADFLGVDLSW
ncbi:MAG: YjgN family protein [Pseudomonadota bacterium]